MSEIRTKISLLRKLIKDTQGEGQAALESIRPSLVEVLECLRWLGEVDPPTIDSENLDELQDITQSFLVSIEIALCLIAVILWCAVCLIAVVLSYLFVM